MASADIDPAEMAIKLENEQRARKTSFFNNFLVLLCETPHSSLKRHH